MKIDNDQLLTTNLHYSLIIECCRIYPDTETLERLAGEIEDWKRCLISTYAHGVYPLVAKSLKTISTVPDHIKSLLKIANLDIARRNMMMTSELLRVMKLLEEHGIQALAIKGPVLSQMIHGDITQRQFADLDILVGENDLYLIVQLLSQVGYSFKHSIEFLKNKFLLKTLKDIVLENEQNTIHIEIHWKLFMGRLFRQSDTNVLIHTHAECLIYNTAIKTLEKDVLLLYLLLHGSKHLWERLEWVIDIDRLVCSSDEINWDTIYDTAKKMEILPMIYLGVQVSYKIFHTPFHPDLLRKSYESPNISGAANNLYSRICSDRIHDIDEYMENFYYLGIEDSKSIISKIFSRLYSPTARQIYRINLPYWLSPMYYIILVIDVIYIQFLLLLGLKDKYKEFHHE